MIRLNDAKEALVYKWAAGILVAIILFLAGGWTTYAKVNAVEARHERDQAQLILTLTDIRENIAAGNATQAQILNRLQNIEDSLK